jgi:isocitrate dehydrogenase (NAD+)
MESLTRQKFAATLIPGDGIGPEVVDATVQILDALGSPFDWDVQHAGIAGVTHSGDPLPVATLDSVRRNKLALKGPLTTPIGEGFRSSNVRLREEFQLFANVRPVRTIVPGRYDKIDLLARLFATPSGSFRYVFPNGDCHVSTSDVQPVVRWLFCVASHDRGR